MKGKILKGIGGFYYVWTEEGGIYECRAKGVFRNKKVKPLVGDDVEIDITDEQEKKGNVKKICERTNDLIRPAVANIDQALVFFAAATPEPNLGLLDRFLLYMTYKEIPTIIAFNKCDLVDAAEIERLRSIYTPAGYPVYFVSVRENEGIESLKEILRGKTTALAGPSGVGKSSLLNTLVPEAQMETGTVSEKIQRGKHTTRHSELFCIESGTFLFDTPGFSTLYVNELMDDETLKLYFPEFEEPSMICRFEDCNHVNEPDCGVKAAVDEGKISPVRYASYLQLYEELKGQRKY